MYSKLAETRTNHSNFLQKFNFYMKKPEKRSVIPQIPFQNQFLLEKYKIVCILIKWRNKAKIAKSYNDSINHQSDFCDIFRKISSVSIPKTLFIFFINLCHIDNTCCAKYAHKTTPNGRNFCKKVEWTVYNLVTYGSNALLATYGIIDTYLADISLGEEKNCSYLFK